MRFRTDLTTENSYGFNFDDHHLLNMVGLHLIGFEKRSCENQYYWNLNRHQEKDTFIFQYTLAGRGEIQLNNQIHQLTKGMAFIVGVPENCVYYLPRTSPNWEFIFVTLKGEAARMCWQMIKEKKEQIIEIDLDAPLIKKLFDIYSDTVSGLITDVYENSKHAYSFLTKLYQFFEEKEKTTAHLHPGISKDIAQALSYMQHSYADAQLQLDDVATYVGLSKYYFIKKFKAETAQTPSNYLSQYRINEAIKLLHQGNDTVKEIAGKVGFSDPKYFTKVFKQKTGFSPGTFLGLKSPVAQGKFLITTQGIVEADVHAESPITRLVDNPPVKSEAV